MKTGYNDPATRARELMLDERHTLAFVALVEHATAHGICPACALAIDGYESTREGHARTCRALLDLVCSKPLAERLRYDAEQRLIEQAAYSFPVTFELRTYPGARFRIDARSSFYSDVTGVQLVLQREVQPGDRTGAPYVAGTWLDFTRDTPREIRKAVRS